MKTHQVLDLVYHEDEGQSCFVGSHQECLDFVSEQGGFGYKIVELLPAEFEIQNKS